MPQTPNKVLILGSAPLAVAARDWDRTPFTHIVAINNAWRIRPDWDILIHPEDFPPENRPTTLTKDQRIVTAEDYVPRQNAYGGFVYAGGTMAFTAGYWALSALKPSVIAYFGCDMVYSGSGKTHFYGNGTADPLRADISLRSLEAKSARLGVFAAVQGCRMVRLSEGESRLLYPSLRASRMEDAPMPSTIGAHDALEAEDRLGYYVPSGRYWDSEQHFDPDELDAVDRLWISAYQIAQMDRVA